MNIRTIIGCAAAAGALVSTAAFAHDGVGLTFATRGACVAELAKEDQIDMRLYKDVSKEVYGNAGEVNRQIHPQFDCVKQGSVWVLVLVGF